MPIWFEKVIIINHKVVQISAETETNSETSERMNEMFKESKINNFQK